MNNRTIYYVCWASEEEKKGGVEHKSKEYNNLLDAKFGADLRKLYGGTVRVVERKEKHSFGKWELVEENDVSMG